MVDESRVASGVWDEAIVMVERFRWFGIGVLCCLGVAACTPAPGDHPEEDCAVLDVIEMPPKAHLTDRNDVQIPTARSLGLSEPLMDRISPIPDELVALSSIEGLVLLPMKSSRPWVVPRMADRLAQLVQRFQERLARYGLPAYPIVVSSALRSRGEQDVLRTTNRNASRDSAHFRGTTVDLHYDHWSVPNRFKRAMDRVTGPLRGMPLVWRVPATWDQSQAERRRAQQCVNRNLKSHLRAVLAEMRAEGLLWALEETRQPVFHITTR